MARDVESGSRICDFQKAKLDPEENGTSCGFQARIWAIWGTLILPSLLPIFLGDVPFDPEEKAQFDEDLAKGVGAWQRDNNSVPENLKELLAALRQRIAPPPEGLPR